MCLDGVELQDPAYFHTRQADVSTCYQEPVKYVYITHNNKLTTDGKPMRCQDLPRSRNLKGMRYRTALS